MSVIAANRLNTQVERAGSQNESILMSAPDAERLALQSRFVRNRFEREILSEIEHRIRHATLLEPSAVPGDLVTMNSRVVLRETETGRQYVYTVAFPACANSRKGQVSVLTPLGSILLGARAGQIVTCPISGAVLNVVVDAILHQPEAAGDYYG